MGTPYPWQILRPARDGAGSATLDVWVGISMSCVYGVRFFFLPFHGHMCRVCACVRGGKQWVMSVRRTGRHRSGRGAGRGLTEMHTSHHRHLRHTHTHGT